MLVDPAERGQVLGVLDDPGSMMGATELFGDPWPDERAMGIGTDAGAVERWIDAVEFELARPRHEDEPFEQDTRERAFRWLARYRLESGEWTADEHARVTAMLRKPRRRIALDEERESMGFDMSRREDGTMRVCVFGQPEASDPDCEVY